MNSHGHTKGRTATPTYRVWSNMLTRCSNPKASQYARYGARGIKTCERWRKFENFVADMGERPTGLSLERIDNDGNYEPGNCRWATKKDQCRNRVSSRAVVRSDGIAFPTIADAADAVSGNMSGIWYVCNGKRKEHRGFGWKYQ